MLAQYKPQRRGKVAAVLTAEHVPVVVLSSTAAGKKSSAKPANHKIRYIVGGVLIV